MNIDNDDFYSFDNDSDQFFDIKKEKEKIESLNNLAY